MKNVLRLLSINIFILLCSCAAPEVQVPIYEDMDVEEALHMKERISAIEAEFSITFYRDDSKRSGDGVLTISKYGDLNLRVYSLGFLAFELTSQHGIIKSVPVLDRTKREILTYGLRDCLFWWDIRDYGIDEQEGVYLIRSYPRKLWIDRKTMLPVQQSVQLEDDRELWFYYEEPQKMGDVWYPSKIRIELSRYSLTLEFDEMMFIGEDSMSPGVKDSSDII